MEVIQHRVLDAWVRKVRQREHQGEPWPAEDVAGQEIRRNRTRGDYQGLDNQQRFWTGMDEVQGGQGEQYRLYMNGEPRRKNPASGAHIGEAQRMTVERVPYRLIHVAEVESVGLVRKVPLDTQPRECYSEKDCEERQR
jgi:hypothetical protein